MIYHLACKTTKLTGLPWATWMSTILEVANLPDQLLEKAQATIGLAPCARNQTTLQVE